MKFKDLQIGDLFRALYIRETGKNIPGQFVWEKISQTTASHDGTEDQFDAEEDVQLIWASPSALSASTIVKTASNAFPAETQLQGEDGLHQSATKYDQGKIRYDLVPATLEREVAKVMTFGAAKYGDLNWTNGLTYNRLYAAIRRHLDAWWSGEDQDPESGLSHLAHVAANIGMLLGAQNREDLDNRKGYCL